MNEKEKDLNLAHEQSLIIDDFFYFFLRLRKARIRAVVDRVRKLHPGEPPEALARRLIDSAAALSLVGGSLFHAPSLIPGIGGVLKTLGIVAGASALTRMHLYLLLEIALVYDRDIDDPARVPEMIAIVGATAAAAVGPPLLLRALGVNPLLGIAAAGVAATALTRLIGSVAIRHYSAVPVADELQPEPAPAS